MLRLHAPSITFLTYMEIHHLRRMQSTQCDICLLAAPMPRCFEAMSLNVTLAVDSEEYKHVVSK